MESNGEHESRKVKERRGKMKIRKARGRRGETRKEAGKERNKNGGSGEGGNQRDRKRRKYKRKPNTEVIRGMWRETRLERKKRHNKETEDKATERAKSKVLKKNCYNLVQKLI